MMKKIRLVLLVVLMFLVVNTYIIGVEVQGEELPADSPLRDFQEILYLINYYHVDEMDLEKTINGAIEGMVDSLDPFSEYLSPEEYKEMQIEFEGEFGGIGIVVNPDLTIVSPIKGTPGDRADLRPEDSIIAIDGRSTEDMTQQKAVNLMRGEPGTTVDLTIERKDLEQPIEVHIVRELIEIPYVETKMIGDDIAYIFIAEFVKDVGQKVNEAVKEFEAQGARALILDLRSDPGGLFTEAVDVASSFISSGKVVSIKQRFTEDDIYGVNTSFRHTDLPLVVLINEGSASASEIVAGAIQDYQRGIIMGKTSFGKGTVQSIFPMENGSALKMTTGRYYTPDGRFIHEAGIQPDQEVDFDREYDGDNQLDAAVEYIEETYLNNNFKKAG
ncbi:PDZ domain-containing protein [Iocasia frigidifontis]|uniref:PDZ domain-containing protein n=1 Tax=Iocasia fonsfrigidae TaxID=2682810 RepID=A0A8A7KDN1_9FIRM|nr:S41 family peptidase [Iocasia fonsfrigidae]QTL97007.1 PDZ domain-containing protein [Iocasia fonsfrigidae]